MRSGPKYYAAVVTMSPSEKRKQNFWRVVYAGMLGVGCQSDVSMSFDVFFGVEKVYTMFWIRVGVFVAIWGVLGDVYQNWG